MNADTIKKALDSETRHVSSMILQYGERLSAIPRLQSILEALVQAASAGDVKTVDVGQTYCAPRRSLITLYLERKDSPLVREIAQLLHIRFTKEPAGESLLCRADVGEVILEINNYLPVGCVVEYHEEYIPGHMGRVGKVVCPKGVEDE